MRTFFFCYTATDRFFYVALTRTLTILYSTTLLSLFTTVQLSLLGRSRYVQAILLQESSDRFSDSMIDGSEGMCSTHGLLGTEAMGKDAEEMEMVYLTLSWWILHVGWKDIGERVRRGVEEVFDGCVPLIL